MRYGQGPLELRASSTCPLSSPPFSAGPARELCTLRIAGQYIAVERTPRQTELAVRRHPSTRARVSSPAILSCSHHSRRDPAGAAGQLQCAPRPYSARIHRAHHVSSTEHAPAVPVDIQQCLRLSHPRMSVHGGFVCSLCAARRVRKRLMRCVSLSTMASTWLYRSTYLSTLLTQSTSHASFCHGKALKLLAARHNCAFIWHARKVCYRVRCTW